MSLRLLIVSAMTLSLVGCATVDIADMASGGNAQAVQAPAEKNVVIKAAEALQANFKDREWEQAPAVERFKSAASILLKGMKKDDANVQQTNSEEHSNQITLTSLRSDILDAGKDVAKTVKAAEIYLDVADPYADLKPELKALEKAFMSSRKAEAWFEKSLDDIEGVDTDTELSTFAASVDRLRESTNQYGKRVRKLRRAVNAPAS